MNDGTDILAARLRKHAVEIERLQEAHQQRVNDLVATIARLGSARQQECELLQSRILAQEEQVRKLRYGFAWTFGILLALASIGLWRSVTMGEFSDGDAPKLQRLTVVTEGYMDKRGTWRSFDTGEPITVKQWKQ